MSGKKGGFITGANAKIELGGKTMAYCTDVGYNVTIQTIPVEAMGRYEVYANEPVSFTVDGTLSVIRYTKRAQANGISAAHAGGNGASEITASLQNPEQSLQHQSSPGLMLASETFDIVVYEKLTELGTAVGTPSTGTDQAAVVKISDCRLTRRGMTLNKRGLYVDQYAFVGLLVTDADADGINFTLESGSGVGEDLS